MTTPRFEPLRLLLRQQTIAALGTLDRGEPYVSMVPFALDEGAPEFLIHVSGLSTHTRDMLEHPRVSLLVVAPEDGGRPQARARATVQGGAAPLDADTARYAAAKALYLQRFPHAADIFALPDFSLFAIRPASVRFIGGFAQAVSLTAELFARALREG
jgi:hypothetical protein